MTINKHSELSALKGLVNVTEFDSSEQSVTYSKLGNSIGWA
jgi:hypothetical protein